MFTPLTGQMCLGAGARKYRKKALCSGLVHISVRETLLRNLPWSNGTVGFAHNRGNYMRNTPGQNYTSRTPNALRGNVLKILYCFTLLPLDDWAEEAFSSNLRSTPGSWVGSGSDHVLTTTEPLQISFGTGHLLVRLFWSASKCDYCVHTYQNQLHQWGKWTGVQFNRTKKRMCENTRRPLLDLNRSALPMDAGLWCWLHHYDHISPLLVFLLSTCHNTM